MIPLILQFFTSLFYKMCFNYFIMQTTKVTWNTNLTGGFIINSLIHHLVAAIIIILLEQRLRTIKKKLYRHRHVKDNWIFYLVRGRLHLRIFIKIFKCRPRLYETFSEWSIIYNSIEKKKFNLKASGRDFINKVFSIKVLQSLIINTPSVINLSGPTKV